MEFYAVTHSRTLNNQICCTVLKLIHLIYNSKIFSKEWNLILFDIVKMNFFQGFWGGARRFSKTLCDRCRGFEANLISTLLNFASIRFTNEGETP